MGSVKTIHSFSWVFFENIINTVIQLITLLTLSRILIPKDYGTIGMITIFIGLGNMFVESGLGASLLKKKNLNPVDFSTLFMYNISVSLIVYFILYFCSDYIALFYKMPDLSKIIKVLSLVIVIQALTIVQNTKLNLDLRFKSMSIVSLFANSLGLIVATLIAFRGYGVWALVYQQLTAAIIRSVSFACINKYFPSFKFSFESFKYQFKFGSGNLGANILGVISINLHSSVLAKVFTTSVSGLYVQAGKMQSIPTSMTTAILDKAIYPILCKCGDDEQINIKSREIRKYTYVIVFNLVMMCSALSYQIIRLILGDLWIESAPLFKILMWSGIGLCISTINRNVLKSLAMTKTIFQIALVVAITNIAILSIFINFPIDVIMYSIVISSILSAMISMYFLRKRINYSYRQQLVDVVEPLIISMVIFFVISMIVSYLSLSCMIEIIIGVVAGVILIFILGILMRNKEINYIKNIIITYLKKLLK